MRIIYFDIDSLRPDHLSCYGYHRKTSPNIDRIASQGVLFENCHASDAPCLPSRTALWSGRFGIHNGVINHGGAAAEPFQDGAKRGFVSSLGRTNWMSRLRETGIQTTTISSFGERHSAFHWYAGFNQIYNPGMRGAETADVVEPIVRDWISRHGKADNWFLHVNLWDPHASYRTPLEYGEPFKDEPLPAWLTEDVRRQHWARGGPHSAREVLGFHLGPNEVAHAKQNPRQPIEIDSMDKVRMMFDGYDTGVRYADDAIGRILGMLSDLHVLDETVVIITADHGENLGELNIYGDHQLADQITTHIPLIVRWPGVTTKPRVDSSLLYHFDFAATMIEVLNGKVPELWDGRSFAGNFKASRDAAAREFLVISQGAWSAQRAVRFDNFICIRSYHDGYHDLPDTMLFDLKSDPHEQHDLAEKRPELVGRAMNLLQDWQTQMMRSATTPIDPMWTVSTEGGALHTRGELPTYLKRLRETGRADFAERLIAKHPREV